MFPQATGNETRNNKSGLSDLPLITIITATHDAANHLPRLAESIRQQTYSNVQWIVADGCSTDETVSILKQNEDVIDCWVSEPDSGIYDAWNKGVEKAQGEWICFLGADDCLSDSSVLETVAAILKELDLKYELVYGQVRMVNDSETEVMRLGEPWQAVKQKFMAGTHCLPTPGLFHRRSLFGKYGKFVDSFRIAGDYELQLRVLISSEPIFLMGITVSNMQLGGISSRPESALISLKEMANSRKMNGLSKYSFGLLAALSQVYLRTIVWRLLGESTTRRLLDVGRRLSGKGPYWTKI